MLDDRHRVTLVFLRYNLQLALALPQCLALGDLGNGEKEKKKKRDGRHH